MFNCNINLFMNKKIITGFLMFALAVFSMSSFVACKDIDEDSYDDLKARINSLSKDQMDLKTAIEGQIAQLKKALEDIKSCNCDPSKFVTKEDLANYATKDDLANYVLKEDYDKKVNEIEERLKKLEEQTPSGKNYDKEIEEIQEKLKILNELDVLITQVKSLATLVDKNSKDIEALNEWKLGWDEKLTDMWNKVGELWAWYLAGGGGGTGGCSEECMTKMAEIENLAKSALELSEKALLLARDNSDRIGSLEQRVSEVVKFIKEEVSLLNSRIDLLLDNMVTGIIIQGTESPVIGYFNTPLDVRSQILAAYYGQATNNVSFPSVKTADYVDASEFWTERNVEVMGINPANADGKISLNGGEQFVSQKNGSETGNAGKLYLTVNPTSVNFEGKTLTLESSKGEEAGVKLEALKKSEKELTMGYTRANNGFYEAEATLTADNIDKAKVRIDYKNLESAAKDMLKEKTKSSVLGFGAALLSSMKDVMPAYAVKATWTSPKNTYNYTQNNYDVYSQYGLAATAIKPFSYAFLKDLNVNLPGEAKLQEIADKLLNKISEKLNLNLPDFSKYDPSTIIKDIVIDPTNPNVTVTIQGTLKDAYGNDAYILVTDGHYRYYMKDETDPWVYNIDLGQWQSVDWNLVQSVSLKIEDVNLYNTLKYVADQINARYGSTSPLADLLNDVIAMGDLNATIQNAFNDVKSEVNGLITKAYNKMNSFFSKAPNKALQPVLVAKSGDKISLLSRAKSNPTKVSGSSLTLIPTSYTLELFAPAYKKFIAVTDVWDAAGNPAAASVGQAANGENMLKVIDSEKTCTINGQAGYTYEIAYSAIDYHGKVVIKRFYVKF
jgi:adenosine/AMP kinase